MIQPDDRVLVRPGNPLQPPRLILFDLDDTLCDYSGARKRRWRVAFHNGDESRAISTDNPVIEAMIAELDAANQHDSTVFADVFARHGHGDANAARRAAEWHHAHPLWSLGLFPETPGVLARIRERASSGMRPRIGIVSNGPAGLQRAKLRLLGLEQHVDFAVISGELGIEKPDRRVFFHALELAGVGPGETVMIGDSLDHDVAGAANSAICSIWLNRRGLATTGLPVRPDHVAANLTDAVTLLGF